MEKTTKNPLRTGYSRGIGTGVLLVIAGVVLLLLNFGVIPTELKHILISWPTLIVLLGIGNCFKRHYISGTIILFTGLFFLIPKCIDVYPNYFQEIKGDFVTVYWPLLLIAAGILLVIGRLTGTSHHHYDSWKSKFEHHRQFDTHTPNGWKPGENTISKSSIFSGGEHIILDPEFKGGELNAIFGGITLDLRRTALPEGNTHLEINAIFGGVTVLAPKGWFITTNVDTIFGGFEDSRIIADDIDKSRKLIISGSCIFGGGELKN